MVLRSPEDSHFYKPIRGAGPRNAMSEKKFQGGAILCSQQWQD